ncbi:MAG: hypothetical protein J0M26_20490 [Planctomycetes bacterium]|nr:hypothetical protein [Planctomycetota bacterium]
MADITPLDLMVEELVERREHRVASRASVLHRFFWINVATLFARFAP